MAAHKTKLIGYKLPPTITNQILYTGTSKEKFATLDDIAKEFFQKTYPKDKIVEYQKEFISLITTDTTSDTGKRGLKSSANLNKVLEQVKNMEKRLK